MIEHRHLRHLLALAEHGNFSRAADALHISQPALSRSIQALDASARDRDREVRLSKGLELGELRIGVGPCGGAARVGPVVGRLNRLHLKRRVRLTISPWAKLPERARVRDVDGVVAGLGELGTLEDFESQPLSEHRANFVCRTDHPLTKLPTLRLQDLYSCPIAGPRLPPAAAQALINAAPNEHREILLRAGLLTIECGSATVLKVILAHSEAFSMMPRFIVEAEARAGELVVLPDLDVDPGQRTCFGAAWLRHRSMAGAGRKFIALLSEHDAALAAESAVASVSTSASALASASASASASPHPISPRQIRRRSPAPKAAPR